jgi:hypothetical protein
MVACSSYESYTLAPAITAPSGPPRSTTRTLFWVPFWPRSLGLWPTDRVIVIDEDLGMSGRTADIRLGFQRLLAEVTLDHIGLVLGLEMSPPLPVV